MFVADPFAYTPHQWQHHSSTATHQQSIISMLIMSLYINRSIYDECNRSEFLSCSRSATKLVRRRAVPRSRAVNNCMLLVYAYSR